MYQGKHTTSNNNVVSMRRTALILSIVLILTCAVGSTIAYFTDFDFSASSFDIGQVSCSVQINDDKSIAVTNTGNVPANIRVAVVANSVNDEGAIYYIQPTVSLGTTSNWEVMNSFYYYKELVAVNETVTLPLIFAGKEDGYSLQIEALAEAIQENAAADAWGYSPSGN